MKTFSEYGVSLPVTPDTRAKFKTKLWRLGQRLSKAGSTKRAQILLEWKQSVWEVELDTTTANKALVKGKRKAEQQLAVEKSKKQRLENELVRVKEELKTTHLLAKRLSNTNKTLSSSLRSSTVKRKRKPLASLSRQQRITRKKQVLTDIDQSLLFLEGEGIHATSVEFVNHDTEEREILDLT